MRSENKNAGRCGGEEDQQSGEIEAPRYQETKGSTDAGIARQQVQAKDRWPLGATVNGEDQAAFFEKEDQ